MSQMESQMDKRLAVHQPYDSGRVYWVVGDRYTFKLTREETNGAFSLFEFVVPPDSGSPPHRHTREDETFYIVSGSMEFYVNGTKIIAQAGDTVFGPKNVPHTFHNVGTVKTKMMVVAVPAGVENFFVAAGVPAPNATAIPPRPTKEDIEHLVKVAPDFGIEIVSIIS